MKARPLVTQSQKGYLITFGTFSLLEVGNEAQPILIGKGLKRGSISFGGDHLVVH